MDFDNDGVGDTCDLCPTLAVYGNSSVEAEVLRNFRDNLLSQTPEGQEIIRLYYQWSPAIVKAMEQDEAFKGKVKKMIEGILPLVEGAME